MLAARLAAFRARAATGSDDNLARIKANLEAQLGETE
jgi:hypothetical protein